MSVSLPHPSSVSSPVVIDTFGAIQVISSRADVNTNLFLNPPSTGDNGPDNSVWSLGTQQQLRWKTNITTYDLMLYQQLVCSDNDCVNGPVMIKEGLTKDTSTFVWTITTGSLSLTPTNTFFLLIRDVENDANQFGSSYLNFTKGVEAPANTAPPARSSPTTVVVTSTLSPPSASTTTSPSTSTQPSSSENSTTSSSTVSETTLNPISTPTVTSTSSSAPTAVPTSSSSGGLSIGAIVGVVIGVIVAVVAAISIGWYLGRQRKIKSKKSPFHPFENPDPAPPVQLSELDVPGCGEQKPIPPPFTPRELHGNGNFDSVKGVRELEAWNKPGELAASRLSGVKSGIYELGPSYI